MSDRAAQPGRLPWLLLAAAALLALATLPLDRAVSTWLATEPLRSRVGGPLRSVLDAGAVVAVLAVLASFPNRRRLWLGFLAPLLAATLLTHALKWTVGRARPALGLGPFHFQPLPADPDLSSFPSGHASSAVAGALLLGLYFPRARAVFYFFAACTGLERIVNGYHYLSDVLAGAAVGGLSVLLAWRVLGRSWYTLELPAGGG